jgi:hypothetical protein
MKNDGELCSWWSHTNTFKNAFGKECKKNPWENKPIKELWSFLERFVQNSDCYTSFRVSYFIRKCISTRAQYIKRNRLYLKSFSSSVQVNAGLHVSLCSHTTEITELFFGALLILPSRTTNTQVWPKISLCGIFGGPSDTGTGFSTNTAAFSVSVVPEMTHILFISSLIDVRYNLISW